MSPLSCRECGLSDCVCALFEAREGGHVMEQQKTQETFTRTAAKAPATAPAKVPAKGGPGSRSVTVGADEFRARMDAAGFTEGAFGGEVTFARVHHRCRHCTVTIYSSLPARGGDTRGLGEDAIRVTAVFSRQTPGRDRPFVKVLAKPARVFRTGSSAGVLDRALERAREAYGELNAFVRDGGCFECARADRKP